MNRRTVPFVLFAVVMAAVCIRLGFWQINRLHQRRAYNALVRSRLDSAEVDVSALPNDSTAQYRRVRLVGTPDYDHELIWATRIHNGSPGLNFLTPYRIAGQDSAVLVDRGWVYSPDGMSVDVTRWRDTMTTVVGYAENFPPGDGLMAQSKRYETNDGHEPVVLRLGYPLVASLPYPVREHYVVMLPQGGDSVMAPDKIARLTVPPLDEGPHFSYAVQWFGFALVALIGAGYVATRSNE